MLRNTPRFLAVAVAAFLAAGLATSASATPLGIVLEAEPDIFADFQSTDYDSVTDTFTYTALAEFLTTGGVDETIVTGGLNYSLTATIDALGVLSAGSLTITGTIPTLGMASGTILTGDLTALGFPDGIMGPVEFTFDVTGGDAASLYTVSGFTGAVIIGIPNGFPGDWTSDFNVAFSGTSDTGITVPEPALMLLLAPALLALGRARRRS